MGQCYLLSPSALFAPFFTPLLVSFLNQIHSAALSANPPHRLRNTLISSRVCVCASVNMSERARVRDSISDVVHKLNKSLNLNGPSTSESFILFINVVPLFTE